MDFAAAGRLTRLPLIADSFRVGEVFEIPGQTRDGFEVAKPQGVFERESRVEHPFHVRRSQPVRAVLGQVRRHPLFRLVVVVLAPPGFGQGLLAAKQALEGWCAAR